jgi:hypothetical protein
MFFLLFSADTQAGGLKEISSTLLTFLAILNGGAEASRRLARD